MPEEGEQTTSRLAPVLLLDEAVGLCRRRYPLLVGITTVVHGPLLAVQAGGLLLTTAWLAPHWPTPGSDLPLAPTGLWTTLAAVALGSWLLGVVLGALASGALMVAVARVRAGRPITLRGAYAEARRRWGALIGVTLALQVALGLTVGLLGAVAWLLSVLALRVGGAAPGPLLWLIQAAPLVAGGLLFCLLMLSVPAAALGDRGAGAAVREGVRRARRAYPGVLATYLLVGLTAAVPVLVAGALGALLTGTGAAPAGEAAEWIRFGLPALALLLVRPLPGTAIALIYLRTAPAPEEDRPGAEN